MKYYVFVFIVIFIVIIYTIYTIQNEQEQFSQPVNSVETLVLKINKENSERTINSLQDNIAELQKNIDAQYLNYKNSECGVRKYKRMDENKVVRDE